MEANLLYINWLDPVLVAVAQPSFRKISVFHAANYELFNEKPKINGWNKNEKKREKKTHETNSISRSDSLIYIGGFVRVCVCVLKRKIREEKKKERLCFCLFVSLVGWLLGLVFVVLWVFNKMMTFRFYSLFLCVCRR